MTRQRDTDGGSDVSTAERKERPDDTRRLEASWVPSPRTGAAGLANLSSRYVDFEDIGQGGMGIVQACTDPNLRRSVAIKTLRSTMQDRILDRTRFIREARVLARLDHPNIVPIYELGTGEDGSIYFTMKRLAGMTLHDILALLRSGDRAAEPWRPLRARIRLLVDICQAVAYAHDRGILHRDLKPRNILTGEFGEVYVLDWGMAKILDEDTGDEIISFEDRPLNVLDGATTHDGELAGTPDYMAPEQATGMISEQDQRTDIYALGGILYQLLTMQKTIRVRGVREILVEITRGKITPPRKAVRQATPDPCKGVLEVPRELDAICMTALAKQREDRYPSVAEMVHDLQSWQNNWPVRVCPDRPLTRFWKWCKRHPVLSSAAASALLVLVTTLGLATGMRHVRHATLVDAADQHRQVGTRIFNDRLDLMARVLALPAKKRDTPRGRQLRRELRQTKEQIEGEYQIAVIFYSQTHKVMRSRQLRENVWEIMNNRLNLSLMLQDREKARKWLKFTRRWVGENYQDAPPDRRVRYLAIAAWADSEAEPDNRHLLLLTSQQYSKLAASLGW